MFVDALREDYDWLADALEEEAATNHYEIDSKPKDSIRKKLKLNDNDMIRMYIRMDNIVRRLQIHVLLYSSETDNHL